MSERILVGMSGGIDSTWAVKKLIDEGYSVEGAILVMHSTSPVADARASAASLGVKLHEIDCTKEFIQKVENNLVDEYARCRTPNPCVVCNSEIKFKLLAEYARQNGFDKIATGHYVRSYYDGDVSRYVIEAAEDKAKDQSYFLWQVEQRDLSMFKSVLSEDKKSSIKDSLGETPFEYQTKESQEICFIPDDERIEFLVSRMSEIDREKMCCDGDFTDVFGKVVGRHKGLIHYTTGQRKGLGIALGRPAYVLKLDPSKNRVVVGFEEDNVCHSFSGSGVKFVSIPEFEGEIECFVRVRHRGILKKVKATIKEDKVNVEFETPEKTVSSGQSAVFYDEKGRVLFGAFIDS